MIFLQKDIGEGLEKFIEDCFEEYPDCLEYSIAKDAAFCLYCYLFKQNIGEQAGREAFVSKFKLEKDGKTTSSCWRQDQYSQPS